MSFFPPRWILLLMGILAACSQTPPEVLVPDNQAPNYDGISTLQIRNYVNRLYIDLLGREPLDVEMDRDVEVLRTASLSEDARRALVRSLQTGLGTGTADTSYQNAFFHRWYELTKARMLEGVSDGEIMRRIGIYEQAAVKDSLLGDMVSYMLIQQEIEKLENVLKVEQLWKQDSISLSDIYGRMLNNYFYDLINMNTFNFIRASYDNLFWRLPTQAEFDAAFPVIEYNQPAIVLGQSVSNKDDYIYALTHSLEFFEGMIHWAYRSLLSREARSEEVIQALEDLLISQDFLNVQQQILVSDEYANF